MEYFNFLPEESTLDILSRVPTESVLECKIVCKTWNHLVSHHPSFNKMHLHHLYHPSDSATDSGKLGFLALSEIGKWENSIKYLYYFDYNENSDSPIQRIRRVNLSIKFASFIGSYNGLICLSNLYRSFCICNPMTKEYVDLPPMSTKYVCWTIGFGYVSLTNEYKVVGMDSLKTNAVVHIYTLGSGTGWRNLGKFNSGISTLDRRKGIFANGALYWMSVELKMIVAFDLAEEKFCKHLSPPPLPPDGNWHDNRIGAFDGILFFAVSLVVEGDECYDIWLLKKKNDDHGMKEQQEKHQMVWSKEFKVDESKVLAVTNSDGVLTYIDNYLDIYDTKSSTSKRLLEFKERFRKILPHKNTLLSLKELGEEDTKILESFEIEETESHNQPLVSFRKMRPWIPTYKLVR